MKLRSLVPALFAGVLAVAAPSFALAQSHDHGHAPATLTLDQGKRWTTDAPLRTHMGDLRAAMQKDLGRIEAGTLPATDYVTLGATVEGKVAAIVRDCKLPPAADAMLHVIVADLVAGADGMQGKAPGGRAAGAHKVVTALNNYAQYFDHPGFTPLG